MRRVNRNGNMNFKIVDENRTVYGSMEKKPMRNEVNTIFTIEEMSVLPNFIIFDADGLEDDDLSIYAKATCDKKDVFDPERGMDIVAAKLHYKEHMRYARKYDRLLRIMHRVMRKVEDLCDKHYKKARAIKHDLDKYYGGR